MDIEVAAGDVKATCVFWDRECAQLLGISTSDLRAEMLGMIILNFISKMHNSVYGFLYIYIYIMNYVFFLTG
jgi:hypothetical protein